ncbi:SusC/RagA family TonB-linked outer membrane protein [Robertkochia marina]|uniref:SusC/RagA family TonB-linked outer membrane protein n=1 Tax=Robertkochia marina TaxID=1227945 RepID=A0A4S3M303_9FLAO|nr:SusC/RagA family TonB-linked outer membrane protein [Robertkochia marina]THD69260.1 SusC/RagA family TonB-linked outer membrane protein [Robertkochia marina]TRZ47482.1 SusC/RagA family TonB-linked outer membrane protein [Robertkochia marina]
MKFCLKKTFLLLGILISHISFAQNQQIITGTVYDETQLPIAGVSVMEEGTSNGTATNFDGEFSITVSGSDANLVFSYLGFKTQTIAVSSINGPLNVVLTTDVTTLEGVVVTSLGFEESKDELGYANSTVGGEAIAQSGEATLVNGLSGKSSGVRISRNSGDPGAGSYIQIRGISSITRNSQPLIVVDGVPISNDTRGNSDRSGVSQQSRLNDLNPNDIESMTVLKGASAAALWGTKALGGVIVIKTKSGQFNKKLSVSYQSTYSIDEINRRYPLQTLYGQGDNGVYNQRARDSWGDLISARAGGQDELNISGEFYVDQDGRVYYPIINKNSQTIYDDSNFDQVFGNGYFWENNLSLSGGNENTSVFFSLGDLDQQGVIRNNSDYRRTTARFNAKHIFTDWLKLRFSSNYTHTESNRIRKGASSSGLYLGLLRTPADFDISGYRGDYYSSSDASPVPNRHRSYREPLGADDSATYNNPLWTINEQENLAIVDRFISNFELTASPTKWLDLISRVGMDHYSERRSQFLTPGSAAGEFRSGYLDQELATNTIFNMDHIAKASFEFNDDLNGSALVGFNYNARNRVVNGTTATNFIQFVDVASGIRDIDNSLPENISPQSSFGRERTAAVYSSLTLSAYDMFFLNGTMRVESASTFGSAKNNTFGFPSTSLAWQFSELFDDNYVFSFGKLRASYGEVGVQPARYNTSNVFVSPTYGDNLGGELNLGLYGNGGFVPTANRGNESLKPERKKELEFGTDLRFFNNRLSLSGTYFQNVTEDVLLPFPVANSTGYASIYDNGAEIENKGFEFDLGYQILSTNNFTWNINANFTRVRNEVTDLAGIESLDLGGLDAVSSRAVEGQPLGVLWGSRSLRDEQGNVVFDEYGFPVQDQTEGIIGDPNPDWQGGVTSSMNWKGFSLSVLFETYQGADIYAGTKSVLRDLGRWEDTGNTVTATRNYFESNGNIINIGETFRGNVGDFGAGPVALTEVWYNGEGGFFSGGNDELYIEDGSWSRIREIALAYNWNSEWLKRTTSLESVRFSVTGRNLFLWSEFEGNDPDTNLSGVSAARGIDYFNNPSTKSYLFSLTLNL